MKVNFVSTDIDDGQRRSKINERQSLESKCGII